MANIYRRDDNGELVLVQRDTDNQVDQNTSDIASILLRLTDAENNIITNYLTLNTKIEKNTSGISGLDASVTQLQNAMSSSVSSLQIQINNLDSSTTTSITSLRNRITELESAADYVSLYEAALTNAGGE